jgi:hypothetical protein
MVVYHTLSVGYILRLRSWSLIIVRDSQGGVLISPPCPQEISYLYHCVAVVLEVVTGNVRTYHDVWGGLLIPFIFDGIVAEFDESCYLVLNQHTILDGVEQGGWSWCIVCGHTNGNLVLHIKVIHVA